MVIRIGLLVSVVLLCPYRATAECIVAPPAFFAEHATIVFSGTVTKVDPVAPLAWSRAQLATFKVDRVWKGGVRRQFDVYSYTRAFERYPLRAGTRYLVFAYVAGEEERVDLKLAQRQAFVIGQCGGGTREFPASASATNRRSYEYSPQEIAELGPGTIPWC